MSAIAITASRPFLSFAPNRCYNNDAALDLEYELMKFKIKEKEVLKKHKNKILSPTESYNAYRTRVKGAKNGQIVRKNYEDLINALHDFYYGSKKEVLTLEECIKRWISSREASGAIEYSTAVHYWADFKKYVQGTEFANSDITTIKKAQFIDFFEKLAGNGRTMRKSTFCNIRTIINGGFKFIFIFS